MTLKELENISNHIIYNFFPSKLDTDDFDVDTRVTILTIIANLQETAEGLQQVLNTAAEHTGLLGINK